MSDSVEPVTVVTGVTENCYEFVWNIENAAKMERRGRLLESQKFEIETGKINGLNSKWVVGLKTLEDRNDLFTIYCKLLSITSKTDQDELAYTFTIRHFTNNDLPATYATRRGYLKADESFDLRGNYHWNQHSNLDVDENGTWTWHIQLSIIEPFSRRDTPATDKLENEFQLQSAKIMKQNLANFLEADSTEYDAKIVSGDGKEFKCHKKILTAHSPIFDSMLTAGLSESQTGMINVTDISGDTMGILLKYMYTGELLSRWSEPDVVVELTYAAGKYQLTDLLNYLDKKLVSMNYDANFTPAKLLALLDMVNKLSLKEAEYHLEKKIIALVVSDKPGGGVLSVFRSE